jgi:hypothetical protein
MTHLDVHSIKDSVQKGTLVELSSDYRTSSTVRAYLPERAPCAMSTTAFHRHVLQGAAGEKRSRVEAICAVLSTVLTMSGEAPRPWFEFKFWGADGRPQSYPMKVEWFAPNKCWVILLPDESLRTVERTARPMAAAVAA